MTLARPVLSAALTFTRYAIFSALLLVAPRVVQAQFRGVRFEITQVGDTTFRFPRGNAGWVKPG